MTSFLRNVGELLRFGARIIDIGASCGLQFADSDHSRFVDPHDRRVVLKKTTRTGKYDFVYDLRGALKWENGSVLTNAEKLTIAGTLGRHFLENNLSALIILDDRREEFLPGDEPMGPTI